MNDNRTINTRESNINHQPDEAFITVKDPSGANSSEIHVEVLHEKKIEEVIESNTDSNKSNNMFQTPSNMYSSNCSIKNDIDYMTPKSRHNLNLLFESNVKRSSQSQRRIINRDIHSPFENKGFLNYPYNLAVSPIDLMNSNSMSSKSILNNNINNNIHNLTNLNPHYVFNNSNEGVMSINIQHKHIYPKMGKGETQAAKTKTYNRKIEFVENNEMAYTSESNEENQSVSSSENDNFDNIIKKPQPIISTSNQSLHKINDQMFLNPFQPFHNTPMPFNTKLNSYSFTKMTPEEYKEKTDVELAKKKNKCNCKKSKCLKLYCECFANGEFCIDCNCTDCSNVIGNEDEKDEVFQIIKDKNPAAMKLNTNISGNLNIVAGTGISKEQTKEEIVENKIGCNCTKSNCSKKYCECYKANVECTDQCRCRDCSNNSCKEKDHSKKFSKFTNEDSVLTYSYEKFTIEKISVIIQNKEININRNIIDDVKSFLCKINNNTSNEKAITSFNNSNSNNDLNNENCNIKNINNQLFIEVSKSVFDKSILLTRTPIVSKLKKRRRNQSSESMESNMQSDYTQKLTKTACETNKKIVFPKGESSVIGKKLNLDLISRSKKLLE